VYDLIVEDATILSSRGRTVADIAVEEGRIVYVGHRPAGRARTRVSAIGRFVMPGMVDTHVHFRDPGHAHKEDWESGSRAAVTGGVTTVCDMPNTNPPTLTRAEWNDKRGLAEARSRVDFGIWVGAAAGNLAEADELMRSGDACGIKVFMGASTGPLLVDDATLVRVFHETQGLIGVHAEDESMLVDARNQFAGVAAPDHNAVRPPAAAAAAVRRLVELVRETRRDVHICHLTTAAELAVLDPVRGDLPITTEVTPQHLHLSTESALGNWMKCNPPIRSELDRRALWTAVKRMQIDTLGSDHAPHTRAEKERPYWEAPSGIPGVETSFPLMMAAVKLGRLSLERFVQLACEAPARRFGFRDKGFVEVGKDADLVMFTEGELTRLDASDLQTRVGWSPFVGQRLAPKPECVWIRGTVVAARGKLVDDSVRGKLVRPSLASA